jgi:hypothetical protein
VGDQAVRLRVVDDPLRPVRILPGEAFDGLGIACGDQRDEH